MKIKISLLIIGTCFFLSNALFCEEGVRDDTITTKVTSLYRVDKKRFSATFSKIQGNVLVSRPLVSCLYDAYRSGEKVVIKLSTKKDQVLNCRAK